MSKRLLNDIKQAFGEIAINNQKVKDVISEYESEHEALSHIEKEKEMRIKFPDIWEMQKSQIKDCLEILKNQLIDLGAENNVDIQSLFTDHDKKPLSLDDFKDIS